MPLTPAERGRRGALATNERMSPEQRHARASAGNLAGAVSRIVAGWPQLTPEQRERVAALLRPSGGAA
jgi:hypothetical protein